MGNDIGKSPNRLRRSMMLIALAGTLFMIYNAGTGSPLAIAFFLAHGAREIHFGIIGALPMICLVMQFIGAYINDHVSRRRPYVVGMNIVARGAFLGILLIGTQRGHAGAETALIPMIALLGVSHLLSNTTTSMWFSWVGDLIPGRILNRFWSVRMAAMQLSWTLSFIAITGFAWYAQSRGFTADAAFTITALVAVAAGMCDMLLISRVPEPPNVLSAWKSPIRVLLEPLRHPEYRTFVLYNGFWNLSIMCGAAFMQVYILNSLGLPLWQATLIWCVQGASPALVARMWGRLADTYGHKPIMTICNMFKPVIVLAHALVTPGNAFPILLVVSFADGMWNAGNMVATNGYMLKISPQQNRSMFIAAIMGISGICGGLAAIVAGHILHATSDFRPMFLNREWSNYQLLFLVSFVLRCLAAFLIRYVREPKSSDSVIVLNDILGDLPSRVLRFPLVLYRRLTDMYSQP